MRFALIVLLMSGVLATSAQNNCQMNFQGDWEFDRTFEAFKGFTTAYSYHYGFNEKGVTRGKIRVFIDSEGGDSPDPSPEQLATYNYICNNQDFIRSVLIDSSRLWFDDYLYETRTGAYLTDREIENVEPLNIKNLMSPEEMYILKQHKDGFAYYGIEGQCTWEADEGFGFLLHKDRIITADVSFVARETGPAYEDMGIEEPEYQRVRINQSGKPELITPHPKYGKLKPEEQCHNQYYVGKLISGGYVDEVIQLHKDGAIEIQQPISQYSQRDYLASAVASNQIKLVEYFLSQETEALSLKEALGRAAKNHNKKLVELLLANGAEINDKNRWGNTMLDEAVSPHQSQHRKINTTLEENPTDFIDWLRQQGAKTKLEIFNEHYESEDYENLELYLSKVGISRIPNTDKLIKDNLVSGNEKMALFLFKKSYANYYNRGLRTAIKFEDLNLIKFCVEQGADINGDYLYNRETYLDKVHSSMRYAKDERLTVLKEIESWMISQGALTQEESIDKLFSNNSISEIKKELALDIEKNRMQTDENAYSKYIKESLVNDKLELAKYFLDLPNLRSLKMRLAVQSGSKDLVDYVLSQGIDINIYNDSGTALDQIPENNLSREGKKIYPDDYLVWLDSRGAQRFNQIVDRLIIGGELDSLKTISHKLPYVFTYNNSVYLSQAISYGQLNIADYFYKQLYYRSTPFSAIDSKNIELLDYYFSKGISPNYMYGSYTLLDNIVDDLDREQTLEDRKSLEEMQTKLLSLNATTGRKIITQLIEVGDLKKIEKMIEDNKIASKLNKNSIAIILEAVEKRGPDFGFAIYKKQVGNVSSYLHTSINLLNKDLTQLILDQGTDINQLASNRTVLDKLKNSLSYQKGDRLKETQEFYDWLVSKGAVLSVEEEK